MCDLLLIAVRRGLNCHFQGGKFSARRIECGLGKGPNLIRRQLCFADGGIPVLWMVPQSWQPPLILWSLFLMAVLEPDIFAVNYLYAGRGRRRKEGILKVSFCCIKMTMLPFSSFFVFFES